VIDDDAPLWFSAVWDFSLRYYLQDSSGRLENGIKRQRTSFIIRKDGPKIPADRTKPGQNFRYDFFSYSLIFVPKLLLRFFQQLLQFLLLRLEVLILQHTLHNCIGQPRLNR